MDSNNKMLMKSETNGPRFLIVKSASEALPLQKLSPFAVQKGFSGNCWNPEEYQKTERWLLLVECGKRPRPKTCSEQTDLLTDQSGSQFTRPWIPLGSNQVLGPRWRVGGWNPGWTERSGCGWDEPSDTEGGEGDPHQHSFLTFGSLHLLKKITVGYLKVKVALFVPSPMHCFNCNKFGHMSQCCKVAAKCPDCGKDKHEGRYEGPKLCSNCNGPHTSLAKDCLVWQKEKEIHRVRVDCLVWQKEKEIHRVRVEKSISFLEAEQLVEAKMLTMISGGKTYATAASTRRESKSIDCQTSLTWFFQNVHLGRLSLTCVLLADPDQYWPALRLPPESRGWYRPTPRCIASLLSVLRRQIGVQPIPPNGL